MLCVVRMSSTPGGTYGNGALHSKEFGMGLARFLQSRGLPFEMALFKIFNEQEQIELAAHNEALLEPQSYARVREKRTKNIYMRLMHA